MLLKQVWNIYKVLISQVNLNWTQVTSPGRIRFPRQDATHSDQVQSIDIARKYMQQVTEVWNPKPWK